MLVLEGNCSENLISSNHFLRDHEPWPPMLGYDNGLTDDYGLLRIEGNNNSIIANHISETIDRQYLKPDGVTPVIIHLVRGTGNYISSNHIVATTSQSATEADESASCFSAQVGALLTIDQLRALDVIAVQVETESTANTVLDTGTDRQVVMNRSVNVFRPIPTC